ncbi:MAG TPA: hypothetical protein VJL35_05375 [Gemmatimonadaceae bacterium]|jgi:hypothetical protein|nr:hypothetical protein [Gemmatimonadaceae bacterium]
MLRNKIALYAAGIALALGGLNYDATAQGKGGGKGQGNGKGKAQSGQPSKPGKGNSADKGRGPEKSKPQNSGRGNSQAKGPGSAKSNNASMKGVSKMSNGNGRMRAHAVLATAAIARASSRGHGSDFRFEDSGDRVVVVNRSGTPLLYLTDNEARELGKWRVGLLDDDVKQGAPSFCRSGAGHPVWGRQWCLDKGFGLGDYDDYRWGRTTDLGDFVYPQAVYQPTIAGTLLQTILGTNAYNRLALHAVELGFAEPLTGRWVSQQTGPQMLLVNSGQYPVAELVDTNRDFRWDDLLVALLLNR